MAKERPYPGSTTVTTVNGGVVGLTRTLSRSCGRSGSTRSTRASSATAPTGPASRPRSRSYTSRDADGRLAEMDEIVDAAVFLLENGAVNGVELIVDGGWHCR